jgi:hypothetical protein
MSDVIRYLIKDLDYDGLWIAEDHPGPGGSWDGKEIVLASDYDAKQAAWKRLHEEMRLEIKRWEAEARRLGCKWPVEETD